MKKRGKKAGRKRFLAGFLSLCMVLTMILVQAKAAEADTQSDESNTASVCELTENNGEYYDSQHVKYTLSTDGSNTATVAGYDKNEINDTKYTDENVKAGEGWEITIPAKVSFEGTEYGVTTVGSMAFDECTQMTKVKFSDD